MSAMAIYRQRQLDFLRTMLRAHQNCDINGPPRLSPGAPQRSPIEAPNAVLIMRTFNRIWLILFVLMIAPFVTAATCSLSTNTTTKVETLLNDCETASSITVNDGYTPECNRDFSPNPAT